MGGCGRILMLAEVTPSVARRSETEAAQGELYRKRQAMVQSHSQVESQTHVRKLI